MVKECEKIIHEEDIWKEGVYHGIKYMETKEAMDEGRQSGETEEVKLTDDTKVVEDKSSSDKGGNAEELVSTTRPDIDAARQEDSVVKPRNPPTTTIRLVHEKELAEMEREREERQRQDQASVDYIASLYDEVQAKIDASEELASRLQMEERERDAHNRRKALYIKEQERDADFMPIGSERDEKMIDKMNKKAAGMDEEEVPEELESTKVEVK
ncbi:hypothetical protein Tco_0628993 [Tanacetum coccineum]|uniref:Uncharacterized protein n=1 Tax=Tanacetum coccineum TaxID=301880 RepID=A0ABQ4WRX6_9ASTR